MISRSSVTPGSSWKKLKIIALKSSVHFRADFHELAGDILVVVAPGPNVADHLQLDYKNLRSGIRLTPLGPEHAP